MIRHSAVAMSQTLRLAVALACVAASGLAPAAALPPEFESLQAIRSAAESYVIATLPEGVRVEATSLDARVRLPVCGEPLGTRLQSTAGANARTIEVRCEAPQRWSLYVPVRIRQSGPQLVLIRPVRAGETISESDLRLEIRDAGGVGAAISDPQMAVGRVAQRPLAAGSALTADALAIAPSVRRGQLVTLVGASGSFEVRTSGKALSDAAAGERLSVENSSSRRIVQGVVRGDGTVAVDM